MPILFFIIAKYYDLHSKMGYARFKRAPIIPQKMKKHILIPYANLAIGGVPTKIIDIVNALGKTHPDTFITVLLQKGRCGDQRSLISNPNARVVDFTYPFSFGKRFAYILWFWKNILYHRPTAILAFLSPYALPALFAKKIFFWFNFRVIVSEDHYTKTMLARMAAPFLQRVAIRLLYPHADTIITPTNSLMQQLGKLCRLPKRKTSVVFNWTRYADLRLPKVSRHWDMIHIGRLVASKNPYRVAQIMQRYIKANPKACCAIIGEGEEADRIRQFVHKNHLHGQIVLLPPTTDVSTYLYRAKIFIFVPESDTEGFPIVLLEAMACGAMILTRQFAGVEEIITDRKNGLVVHSSTITPRLIRDALKKTGSVQKNARLFIKRYCSLKNIDQYIIALG